MRIQGPLANVANRPKGATFQTRDWRWAQGETTRLDTIPQDDVPPIP